MCKRQVQFSVISSNMPIFSERYKNRKQHGVSAPMERPETQEAKTEVTQGGVQTPVETPTQGDMTNARVAMGNEASKVAPGGAQTPVVNANTNATSASTDDVELPQMPKEGTWADARAMVEELGYKLESEDDKKKRLKMEAIRKMRSGISDGMRSLASAFFVTHGGLPTYDPDKGLLKKAEEDIKESDAKREKSDAEYRAVLERAKERMRDTAYKKWDMAMQAYKTRMENKRAKETAERDERRYQSELDKHNKSHEETVRHNKASEAIARTRAAAEATAQRQANNYAIRHKDAVTTAWASLVERANREAEKGDETLLKILQEAGKPRFNSMTGSPTGYYEPPTLDQMKVIIEQYPEASEIYDAVMAGKKPKKSAKSFDKNKFKVS